MIHSSCLTVDLLEQRDRNQDLMALAHAFVGSLELEDTDYRASGLWAHILDILELYPQEDMREACLEYAAELYCDLPEFMREMWLQQHKSGTMLKVG